MERFFLLGKVVPLQELLILKGSCFRMKKFLFFICLCPLLPVMAQTDTEFWFAAPKLHEGSNRSEYIQLCFVTYDEAATIVVTQPANSQFNHGTPLTLQVAANSYGEINLYNYRTEIETTPANTVLDRGLFIRASSPVTAYYAITKQNSEIYTLKGKNALGTDFIVPMQKTYRCGENGHSSIEVIATQDDTQIRIIPSNDCEGGMKKGEAIDVTLQKGQCYAIRGAGQMGNLNLGGSIVKSLNGKLIAVNSTDDFLTPNGGDKDLAGDQIVPLDVVGAEYVAIKNEAGNAEEVCIYAVEEGITEVEIGGSIKEVEYGSPLTYKLLENATYIRSTDETRRIIVYQLTSNGNELGGTMLPSISCTGSSEVAYKPLFSNMGEATIGIVVRAEDADGLQGSFIEDDYQTGSFKEVPHSGGAWLYYYRPLRAMNGGTIRIKNTKGLFHMSVNDKGSGTFSYGYFSNYSTMALEASSSSYYYMKGDDVNLSTEHSDLLKSVTWFFPDGTTYVDGDDPVKHPVLENVQLEQSGMYVVQGTHKDECPVDNDTIFISVFDADDLSETYYSCRGVEFSLTAPGYGPYEWNTGQSEENVQTVTVVPWDDLSTYTVDNYHAGENMLLGADGEVCPEVGTDTVFIGNVPGNIPYGIRYLLSAEVAATAEELESLYFRVNGMWLTPDKEIAMPNGWKEISCIWEADASNVQMSLEAENGTTEDLCVRNIRFSPLCLLTDTFHVAISDSLSPVITASSEYLCNAETGVTLDAGDGYEIYQWNTGETTPTIVVHEAGIYSCRAGINDGSCKGTAFIEILPAPALEIKVEQQPQICPDENRFDIPLSIVTGEAVRYELDFDEQAEAAGFVDESGDLAGDAVVSSVLPDDVIPQVYGATLRVYESTCDAYTELPLHLMVKYPASQVIAQRWDEVLGVVNETYNGGYEFTAFQWYKNGEVMEGETNANLYDVEGFDGEDCYAVMLTRSDGMQIVSCEICPEPQDGKGDLFSTLLEAGSTFYIHEPVGGEALFYDLSGILVSRQTYQAGKARLSAPAERGIYILSLQANRKHTPYKVIIK